MHLDIIVHNFDDEQRWKSAITRCLIPRLPQVHQISLSLDQWYRAGVIGARTPAEFEAHQPGGEFRNYFMSALLELRKLPLSRVTFVISDAKIFYERNPSTDAELRQYRWTLAEKQAWARYVKASILRKDNQPAVSSSLMVGEKGKANVNAEVGESKLLKG